MTNNQRLKFPGRRGQGGGLAWKSGLVASSVGAVLMGWAMLGRADAAPSSAAAQIAPPQPRVIVVQVPIAALASHGRQQPVRQNSPPVQASTQAAPGQTAPVAARAQIAMPSMPQKPVFQRPVTRTRGS
ncbi:MAG: hypothetical protein KJZ86_03900 [Caldilineaceae bacterium]|nr:hypothetical protein [Caldilineaceae bacterium]HRJ41011.1 hypothetical protein [Caldilineaceae bacterium]